MHDGECVDEGWKLWRVYGFVEGEGDDLEDDGRFEEEAEDAVVLEIDGEGG